MTSINRKRGSQLSIRVDETLYSSYKALIEQEGITLTSDIENYMRSRLGEKNSSVIDIHQMARDINYLKESLGKLSSLPQRTEGLKVS
jgi:hypothetical protein